MRKYATIEVIANGFTVELSRPEEGKPFDGYETHYAPNLEEAYEKVKEFFA